MGDKDLNVTWDDHGREPKVAPDPAYPHGKDVLIGPGGTAACWSALPWPAPRCGVEPPWVCYRLAEAFK